MKSIFILIIFTNCLFSQGSLIKNVITNNKNASSYIVKDVQDKMIEKGKLIKWFSKNPDYRLDYCNTRYYNGSGFEMEVVYEFKFTDLEKEKKEQEYYASRRSSSSVDLNGVVEGLKVVNEILKDPIVQEAVKSTANAFKEAYKESANNSSYFSNSSSNNNSSDNSEKDKKYESSQKVDEKLIIEFIETENTGECNYTVGKPKIRYFKVINKIKNEEIATYKIVAYNGSYYEDCPDGVLVGNVKVSDYTIKSYLISQYEAGHPFSKSPDNYTLIEKNN